MNVFLIAGTRPNFMKIAPIYRASLTFPNVSCRIIHTGPDSTTTTTCSSPFSMNWKSRRQPITWKLDQDPMRCRQPKS